MKIKNSTTKFHGGFTLVEMMITATIFIVLCVFAMVSLQIFGLKTYTLSSTKLIATADARKALNSMSDKIRSAQGVAVGTYSGGAFHLVAYGANQVGNALIIYPSDDASGNGTLDKTHYVIFYADASKTNLSMVTNNVVTVLAQNMNNPDCFLAEDAFTNILTDNTSHRVIHLRLTFLQQEFSGNTSNIFDYYELNTRVTCRVPDSIANN